MEGYGPQNPLPNDMGLGGEHQSCTRTALRDAKFAADWLQRVLRHQFRSNCRVGKRFSQVLHRRRKSLHEKPRVKRLFYADRKDGLLRLAGAE